MNLNDCLFEYIPNISSERFLMVARKIVSVKFLKTFSRTFAFWLPYFSFKSTAEVNI